MDLQTQALLFATRAHAGQTRKGAAAEPYICHPIRVAALIRSHYKPNRAFFKNQVFGEMRFREVIAAAYLHDVVEDCGVSVETLRAEFGPNVARMVEELSNTLTPEDGNRAYRSEANRARLAQASPAAQTIKAADIIDNMSIAVDDPKFARTYVPEKQAMLAVLTKAAPTLLVAGRAQIAFALATLKEKENA